MPDHTLSLGGYAPRDSSHSDALAVLAETIETSSEGRIAVSITWNILDQGRPASDLLVDVEAGDLTLCYFSTSYLGNRVPLLNVLETPFLFSDVDAAHAALDGALGAAITEATRRATGFDVLGYWDNGFRHLTNRIRPIHKPEDCAGMRVRLQPNDIHSAMIESWGAIPVAAELSEGIRLITALEVDAQENPLANTVAYGVSDVHRHVTMTGHLYGARGLYAHPPTLAGLSLEDQAIVVHAARAAVLHQRNAAAAKEVELRRQLEAAGLLFVDLTADARAAFVDASGDVIASVRNRLGGEIFELASA